MSFTQELTTKNKEKVMNKLKLVSLIAVANLAFYTLTAQSLEGTYWGDKAQFVL
ncbi:MAG: hypothetical protein PHD43_01960 [Methylococcales bacterium]|nr:hypothetical protein [Methylococcales bacterium]